MRSTNPVLSRYAKDGTPPPPSAPGVPARAMNPVALPDVIVKSLVVFAITVVFAVVGWNVPDQFAWLMFVALIAGVVLGIVNAVKRTPSPTLVCLYAVAQGLFLGAISNGYNDSAMQQNQYQGLVLQAVLATMTTFAVMLTLYLTGLVKVNRKFTSILLVAGVSYAVIGLASLVAALFGVGGGWGFYGVSGIGLALCVVGVVVASLFLLLDFEAISRGIAAGAPESESWRMAFGLLMTLIWIYLEFLRLLALFSRD